MNPDFLQTTIATVSSVFAQDPTLYTLQLIMLCIGIMVVYLVFFTTKDVLQRTNSFVLMLFSIALVAFLPIIGFLLYLLIRPNQTIHQKEVLKLLTELYNSNQNKDKHTLTMQQKKEIKEEFKSNEHKKNTPKKEKNVFLAVKTKVTKTK